MTSINDTLNTQYLHFDAFSIKDSIKKYLAEDSKFTDFMYEGSNLSVIIDLVALMYQCLIYNLNNTAAESMFADTQIYSNINRLVKLIGYNPRGYTPCVVETIAYNNLKANSIKNTILPRYAYIDTGLKDSKANSICYSTIEDTVIEDASNLNITLYNGIWRQYKVINIAKGSAYEIFDIALSTNVDDGIYIAYPFIDVYVKSPNGILEKWERVDNIYSTENSIHNSEAKIYELRLTEYGTYTIKCGDGIHGAKFPANAEIYVFYLQCNGAEGHIDSNVINNTPFKLSAGSLTTTQDLFDDMFSYIIGTSNQSMSQILSTFTASNKSGSSDSKIEETVDEIRENAPDSLNIANRLITTEDVAAWLKLNNSADILDVKTMNNWQYITKFYAWLYNIGNSVYKDGKRYINSNILAKHDLSYTNAADSNSIYAWIKTLGSTNIHRNSINREMENIKLMTSNIILMPSLDVKFAICVAPEEYVKKYYFGDNGFNSNNENYIEITVEDSLTYSPSLVKNQVKNAIMSFFKETNFLLGNTVDISKLLNDILSIHGITNIRTCFVPPKTEAMQYNVVAKPGLYFATWTNDVITPGDDLDISSMNRKLEDFQFPSLYNSNLDKQIKIITTNSNIAKVN